MLSEFLYSVLESENVLDLSGGFIEALSSCPHSLLLVYVSMPTFAPLMKVLVILNL